MRGGERERLEMGNKERKGKWENERREVTRSWRRKGKKGDKQR